MRLPTSISKELKWLKNTNSSKKTDFGSGWPSKKLFYLLEGAAQGCFLFIDMRPQRPPAFFVHCLWNDVVHEANQKQVRHCTVSSPSSFNGTDRNLNGINLIELEDA